MSQLNSSMFLGPVTSWKSPVADVASLPTAGNVAGDARVTLDGGNGSPAIFVWDGASWVKVADGDAVQPPEQRTATGNFTTTSASSTLITGAGADDDMEFLAPGAGDYLVWFNCEATVSAAGRQAHVAVFINNTEQQFSDHPTTPAVGGDEGNIGTMAKVTLIATDDVSIRARRGTGGPPVTVTIGPRSAVLLKVAS